MLILYRRKGEAILIGEDITVSVVESSSDGVRLAIDAPRSIPIMRKELMEAVRANQEAAEGDIGHHINDNKETLRQMSAILKKREH